MASSGGMTNPSSSSVDDVGKGGGTTTTTTKDETTGRGRGRGRGKDKGKKVSPLQHLLAGGTAGFVESSICHPLDTVKTRMQLRRRTNIVEGRALSGSGSGGGSGSGATVVRAGGATTLTTANVVATGMMGEPSGWKNRTMAATTTTTKSSSSSSSSGGADVARAAYATSARRVVPSSSSSVSFSSPSSFSSIPSSSSSSTTTVTASLGPFGTARRIVQREGPFALYKGLTAVYTGIIPKMAIRFVSFEYYKETLGGAYVKCFRSTTNDGGAANGGGDGKEKNDAVGGGGNTSVTFVAGLLSGLTEAIVVVTPAEVCKIRMQSQYHSMMDPTQMAHAKYKNVLQTAMLVVREEGLGALYKGVVPTMLRQGCNQAVNFTVYNWSKDALLRYKRDNRDAVDDGGKEGAGVQLDHWQTLVLGGLSGGMGPLANNPLDVVKTRMQKQVILSGKKPKYDGLLRSCVLIANEEGVAALWKGITPRLMRIMPGQAITFMTYEAVTVRIERYGLFD